MKNKAGMIIGFVGGLTSFLLLFKLIFLTNIPREDELAPGIVVAAAVLNGLLFAYIGARVQQHLAKKKNHKS